MAQDRRTGVPKDGITPESAFSGTEARSRDLFEMWRRMQPAATRQEASRIAMLMAGRAEPDLADAVAKLAFWRATRNPHHSRLPRELEDALAYSAFLDLVILSGQTALADPEDGPWVPEPKTSCDG